MKITEHLTALTEAITGAHGAILVLPDSGHCPVHPGALPDAEKAFWEQQAIRFMEQQADILIHASAHTTLTGPAIFSHYLQEGCRHQFSGRLFTRDLAIRTLKSLEALSAPEKGGIHIALIRPFFTALLHLHARSASPLQALPAFCPDDLSSGPGRFMTLAALLRHLAPYCRLVTDSPALALNCSRMLENLLLREREACLRDTASEDFLRYGTEIEVLRACVVSHPLMRAACHKAAGKQRIKAWRRKTALFIRGIFVPRQGILL